MLYDMVEQMEQQLAHTLEQQGRTVTAEQVGLDRRCGTLMVCEDCVVTENARALDYYGGFEYIDDQHKTTVGRYTIYWDEDGRVLEVLQNADYGVEHM